LGSLALSCCISTSAFAQDALALVIHHCVDQSRAVSDRIGNCKLAAQAQGIDTDVRAFAYVDLALAYDSGGDHDSALQALNSAADLRSDVWQVFFNRGRVQVERGDPDAGLADYNRLLQIDPAKIPMFRQGIADYRTLREGETTNMSSSAREANEHTAALKDLKITVAHGFARRCQQRLKSSGASDSALGDCNQAVMLVQGDAKILALRGIVHMQRKELSAGQADFDAAVKADPHFADALFLRGLSERVSGNMVASQTDIAAARALDPQVTARYVPKSADPNAGAASRP
jgi:tetratricopeptide (TPR) repeat protein